MNSDTLLKELFSNPSLSAIHDCFLFDVLGSGLEANKNKTLRDLNQEHPSWSVDDMLYGVQALVQAEKESRLERYSLHGGRTSYISLLAKNKTKNDFVLLCSGGAYGSVCNLVEAFPAAAKCNEAGFDAYILNYETATKESFSNGLFPQPFIDLATALSLIQSSRKGDGYYLVGYSAGGHLVSLFSSADFVVHQYHLPSPKGIILGYPFFTMEMVPEGPAKNFMCAGLFGQNYSAEDLRKYSVFGHSFLQYPSTYIVHALDDDTIDPRQVEAFEKSAKASRVPVKVETIETGGHGFGIGRSTAAAGYIERALDYFEKP